MNIQWYPGHMSKTRRMLEAELKSVDAVCEVLDARIPRASRNPEIDKLIGAKKRVVLLNKSDMADPATTKKWLDSLEKEEIERWLAGHKDAEVISDDPEKTFLPDFLPRLGREAARVLPDASEAARLAWNHPDTAVHPMELRASYYRSPVT